MDDWPVRSQLVDNQTRLIINLRFFDTSPFHFTPYLCCSHPTRGFSVSLAHWLSNNDELTISSRYFLENCLKFVIFVEIQLLEPAIIRLRPYIALTQFVKSIMALLLAIRHGDYRVVREMVQEGASLSARAVDVNEEVHLESATAVPQELPSFPTTPLLEACRCGDERILRLLLGRPDVDVNKRTTKLRHTALADACARGDAVSVRILLEDPRTEASLGDDLVAHPALYACMNGSVDVLQALASHGVLNDDLESSLVATAAASEQVRNRTFCTCAVRLPVFFFLIQYFACFCRRDVFCSRLYHPFSRITTSPSGLSRC